MEADLEGRVMLVTGATDGVGLSAARTFAARGATLTLVGRDATKTRTLCLELRHHTGNEAVDFVVGDLSTLRGMRAVAAEFRACRSRLDVLVNNAGALFHDHETTVDGLEKTFALNHLAYYVVTRELLDLVKKTPGARVINTSSAAHKSGRIDLTRIATRDGRAGYQAYADSKLANIVFTLELARRLTPHGVTANCLHPGYVRSHFAHETTGALARLIRSPLATRFARTPEQGADTLVWLATSREAGAYNGKYFVDRTAVAPSRAAEDPLLGAELWALSARLATRPPSVTAAEHLRT